MYYDLTIFNEELGRLQKEVEADPSLVVLKEAIRKYANAPEDTSKFEAVLMHFANWKGSNTAV